RRATTLPRGSGDGLRRSAIMSKPFRALLWKETLEVSRHAVPALLLVAISFYASVAGSSTSHFIGGDSDPARHFGWFGGLTALVAIVIGFWQTWRESEGDMWGHVLHRPATRAAIFAAKPVVGVGALLISVGLPYALAMWWYAVPGHRPVPFDRSFL